MTKVEQTVIRRKKELESRIKKEEMILCLWRNGNTQKEIAEALNITSSRVYQIIRKAKIREQKN